MFSPKKNPEKIIIFLMSQKLGTGMPKTLTELCFTSKHCFIRNCKSKKKDVPLGQPIKEKQSRLFCFKK
jgi:hypothetical protein